MLKNFFNRPTKTITSTAVIIALTTIVSRLLGILRDRILAGEFGAGATLDTYYAAFRIPDLVFNLLVLGTLSAGFIPVFTIFLNKDKDQQIELNKPREAWDLVNNLLNVLLITLILFILFLIVFTKPLIQIIAPGFSSNQLQQTTTLARIMFLSPILLGISGLFGGVLQSFRRFFVYSLAPIFYNIGIIVGALFFTPLLGITGLAWGVVLGATLHCLIQLPIMLKLGYRYFYKVDLADKKLKQIIKMMVPRTLGLTISQFNYLIITAIGSSLMAGSITVFNLAMNLQSFPLGIFGVSYAIAAFPTLSELAENKKKFIENFSLTLRQILFLIIPASALLILLRAQIVRVILGSGHFDWEDTILTLNTLSYLAISLFAQSLILLFARAFYAQKDSKTPFYTGLISAFFNVIASFILAYTFELRAGLSGVEGLALAFSLSNIVNLALLWLILRNKLQSLDEFRIFNSLVKILIATIFMSITVQAMKYFIEPYVGTQTFMGIFLQGATAGCVGIICYLGICLILRSPEAKIFADSLKQKFIKTLQFKQTEIIE